VLGISRIERRRARAGGEHAEEETQELRTVGLGKGDAVAWLDAARAQKARECRRRFGDVAERKGAASGEQGGNRFAAGRQRGANLLDSSIAQRPAAYPSFRWSEPPRRASPSTTIAWPPPKPNVSAAQTVRYPSRSGSRARRRRP